MGLIKVGYFRVTDQDGSVRYVSYDEYKEWDAEAKEALKRTVEKGSKKLYCACCSEDSLALTITAALVVRVANNKNQDQHMESCPKSINYAGWISQTKGVSVSEDKDYLFNISLPTLVKSRSSSSSSGTGDGVPKEKRTGLRELVVSINRIAWEKQTFSIKKKIREARREGVDPAWEYKDIHEFNKLFFGVTNDISCKCQGVVMPFSSLVYRKSQFYQCSDRQRQWFIYALIDKVAPYKASRKYQYVTVCMPSNVSASKAVVRVHTEDFQALFEQGDEVPDSHRILAGYITRTVFTCGNESGGTSEWITLSKGVVLSVSENGLYVDNALACRVANRMCSNHIIFTSPYLPVENFGNEYPSFEVEVRDGRNILIDCPADEQYEVHKGYALDNEEYDCLILKPGEEFLVDDIHF